MIGNLKSKWSQQLNPAHKTLATAFAFVALVGCHRDAAFEKPVDPQALIADLPADMRIDLTPLTAKATAIAEAHALLVRQLRPDRDPELDNQITQAFHVLSNKLKPNGLSTNPDILKLRTELARILDSNEPLISTDESKLRYLSETSNIFIGNLGLAHLHTDEQEKFVDDLKLGQKWLERILDSKPNQDALNFALRIQSEVDIAGLVAAHWDLASEKSCEKLLEVLPSQSGLTKHFGESLKRDMLEKWIPTIATRMPNSTTRFGGRIEKSAAYLAVKSHKYPLDRHATAKLLGEQMKVALTTMRLDERQPDDIKDPAYAIDWEPVFRLYGNRDTSRDDIDSSTRISRDQITKQSQVLAPITNPYGRWMVSQIIPRVVTTSNIGVAMANREATRIALVARLFRIRYPSSELKTLDQLVSAGLMPSVPKSPFASKPFWYEPKSHTLYCSRPFPKGIPAAGDEATLHWSLQVERRNRLSGTPPGTKGAGGVRPGLRVFGAVRNQ